MLLRIDQRRRCEVWRNIAWRKHRGAGQALASPGGIARYRGVRDHLRDRVDSKFSDLGEHCEEYRATRSRVPGHLRPNGEPALPEPPISSEGEPADRPRPSSEASPDNAVEIAFWQSVQATDDDAEYAIYLEQYPEGTFAELARARLEGTSTIEEPGVELAFWETVRGSEDPTMIKAYLDKYPKGEFRPLAEILLQRLLGEHGPASEQNR